MLEMPSADPGEPLEIAVTYDGPDLREVEQVLGTGGVFAHRSDGDEILAAALQRRAPRSLAPQGPALAVDGSYILAAAGLLASLDAEAAALLLQRELVTGALGQDV